MSVSKAFKQFVIDDFSEDFLPEPFKDYALCYNPTTGNFKTIRLNRLNTAPIAIDPVPADTTIDITALAAEDDGKIIQISGTTDIDDIVIDEGEIRILEFTDSGGKLTTAGNLNLTVALERREGMRVEVVGRAGSTTDVTPLTHIPSIGDIDGTGNGAVITVNDGDEEVLIQTGPTLATAIALYGSSGLEKVQINAPAEIHADSVEVALGDLSFAANGTSLTVNDAAETVIIAAANGLTISSVMALAPTAFASLPGSPTFGMVAAVSDSNTKAWGNTVAGGGSDQIIAYYNGANWVVMGGF